MAGVLSFKSISYCQNLVLTRMFWAYFSSSTTILTCITGLMAFQRLLLLEYGGGPEKDRRCLCFCGGGTLHTLSPDLSCQQDVLWHDGNSPGVDGTQVGHQTA